MLLKSLVGSLVGLLAASSAVAQTSDIDLIAQRRRADLSRFATPDLVAQIPQWLASQSDNGTWPGEIDYTAGCNAQRANWPIQYHWWRVITFASAWSGLNPFSPAEYAGRQDLLDAALKGAQWWMENDYTNMGCVGLAPNAQCPCGTPGLWNPNWFGQVILMPTLISTGCLLLQPANLTGVIHDGCVRIPQRIYDISKTSIPGVGVLTGANTVNVMQHAVTLAAFTGNTTILVDALDRAMQTCTFSDTAKQDGIHRDGSFLQHAGILYNGNYGTDLMNAFVQLEGEAIGTQYAANDATRAAMAAMIGGSEWMIYVDKATGREKWDFNTIGRFVSFATSDLQASGDTRLNTTLLGAAVADFTGPYDISDTVKRLQSNGSIPLTGNRGFFASDYMVHRNDKYVLANKMISTRSWNTEFTNSANPLGYHLGQGTLFSYVTGAEYTDIQAEWDWYLMPGTTVVLRAPTLSSSWVGVGGKKEYVGVVSDGTIGASVMDYIDPHDGSLSFRKAWFFLGDSVLVTTSDVHVNRAVAGIGSAPVVSVLDNRAAAEGGITVDGNAVSVNPAAEQTVTGSTLSYGGNSYAARSGPFNLTVFEGPRTGNWSAISTSSAGVKTTNVFHAFTTVPEGNVTSSYEFYPGSSAPAPGKKSPPGQGDAETTPINVGGTLGAARDGHYALSFWPSSSLNVTVSQTDLGWNDGQFSVSTSNPALYLFSVTDNNGNGKFIRGHAPKKISITVAEPTQKVDSLTFSLSSSSFKVACASGDAQCQADGNGAKFTVALPRGGFAGQSVTVQAVVN